MLTVPPPESLIPVSCFGSINGLIGEKKGRHREEKEVSFFPLEFNDLPVARTFGMPGMFVFTSRPIVSEKKKTRGKDLRAYLRMGVCPLLKPINE